MSEQHTQDKSLKELAEAAQMMPWDRNERDVPFDARQVFKQAITADHYLEILAQRDEFSRRIDNIIGLAHARWPNVVTLENAWDKMAGSRMDAEMQRDKLLAALKRLSFAAMCRDNTMGDPCRLIEVKAELLAANAQAIAAIAKVEGGAG